MRVGRNGLNKDTRPLHLRKLFVEEGNLETIGSCCLGSTARHLHCPAPKRKQEKLCRNNVEDDKRPIDVCCQ